MQLTGFQIKTLKRLLTGEMPLSALCDSPEGEALCWSGLVGIRPKGRGIYATATLTDRGRALVSQAA
jgi:hypothetical protein